MTKWKQFFFLLTLINVSLQSFIYLNECSSIYKDISLPNDFELLKTLPYKLNNIAYSVYENPKISSVIKQIGKDNNKFIGYKYLVMDMEKKGSINFQTDVNEVYIPDKMLVKIKSDHLISNERADVELQIIHTKDQKSTNTKSSDLLVISILLLIDEDFESIFDSFELFNKLEQSKSNSNLVNEDIKQTKYNILDLNNYIDPDKIYYYYQAKEENLSSNCGLSVNWLVLNNFFIIKDFQYNELIKLLEQSQALNDFNDKNSLNVPDLIKQPEVSILFDYNSIIIESDYLFSKTLALSNLCLIVFFMLIN